VTGLVERHSTPGRADPCFVPELTASRRPEAYTIAPLNVIQSAATWS
jgi:hypothetical protein